MSTRINTEEWTVTSHYLKPRVHPLTREPVTCWLESSHHVSHPAVEQTGLDTTMREMWKRSPKPDLDLMERAIRGEFTEAYIGRDPREVPLRDLYDEKVPSVPPQTWHKLRDGVVTRRPGYLTATEVDARQREAQRRQQEQIAAMQRKVDDWAMRQMQQIYPGRWLT